ncbi:MAG TPA: ABC transporter substrate-binding protein [Acetobacteraceae bacterium]|jgi:phospholipid transport system substrate-binding protein|nr:ABC transporter substrate-binding protein [Acetobacteraceae bacterium]
MTRTAIHRRMLLGASAALLAAAGSPVGATADDTAAAVAPIQQLCNMLMAIMRAGQSVPFAQRFDQLAPVVAKSFNLDTILQVSVGPTWPTLPPDQQAMLKAAFRRYTVASYVSNFDEYSGQRFEISPTVRALANGEQVVATRIIPRDPSGETHVLDYVMRQGPQGWQAVDVLMDGTISRVAVQRSDFRDLLARGGATALAKSLQEKTANLSGGSA